MSNFELPGIYVPARGKPLFVQLPHRSILEVVFVLIDIFFFSLGNFPV